MSHINPVKPAWRHKTPGRAVPLLALLLIVLTGLTALSGCGSSTHRYVDSKDVEVESKIRMEGDLLVMYGVLRNSSSGDVNNSVYRVIWYDADDFWLGETAWKPVKVKGGAVMHVREVCTVPGAKKGVLEISNDARKP